MSALFAGWDGGGTGTTAVCLDEQGREAGRARFGPLNLNGADAATVERTVRDALSWMRDCGGCASLCVGAAGVSNPEAAALVRRLVRAGGYEGRLVLAGDHEIALRGAVGQSGAVLIAGTGAVCLGRGAQGETARAGGGGHLIDDGGSGYAIGRDVLSAVLRSLDGREPPTALREALRAERGGAEREDIVACVYRQGREKADIARRSHLLAPAYALGDGAARAIARRAAEELCALLEAVTGRLSMPDARTALLGSILNRCEPVRRETTERIHKRLPRVRLCQPAADAATGAALMAREKWEDETHA